MKLYISADIEGVTGVTSWSETQLNNSDSNVYIKQMEKEVLALCECAYKLGFTEIVVKDAHETGRNMNINSFPKYVRLLRGWSGHPFNMIEGIDESFDAIAFIGYHSGASKGTSPLSHTLHVSKLNYIKINGIMASEFLVHYYAGLSLGIPTLFLSGDQGICDEVKTINKHIGTVATKSGFGKATLNEHPETILKRIKDVFSSIDYHQDAYVCSLPERFGVEMNFKDPAKAYWASFYPGAQQVDDTTISFNTTHYMDVLRLFSFTI
jgi:D-amino peptidase